MIQTSEISFLCDYIWLDPEISRHRDSGACPHGVTDREPGGMGGEREREREKETDTDTDTDTDTQSRESDRCLTASQHTFRSVA